MSGTHAPAVRGLVAAYRRALRLYPEPFRARFGPELIDTFARQADAARRRGVVPLVGTSLRAFIDLLRESVAERRPDNDLNHPGGLRARTPPPPEDPRSLRTRMESLRLDLQFAARVLRRAPAMTAAIVLTLALGIGAVTIIFSAVNGIILRPLPYPDSHRLVALWQGSVDDPLQGAVSYIDYRDWHEMTPAFENLAAINSWRPTLTGVDRPESLQGARVAHQLLDTLRMQPVAGRDFIAADDHADAPRRVLISTEVWERHYGRAPAAIGQDIQLDDLSWEIIGVLPEGFELPGWGRVEVARPLRYEGLAEEISRGSRFLNAVGRLADGTELETANEDLARVSALIAAEYPNSNEGVVAWAQPLIEAELGDTATRLVVLLAAVGLVLLIAVANVANLLLARASTRREEIAVRVALGAGARRLAQQLLTEALLLAALGGVAGIVLATVGTELLVHLAPADLPRLDEIGWDLRVAAFAAGVTLVSGLLFGLAPALQALRQESAERLRSARGQLGRGGRALQRGLVVAQIAIALTLLVGSGLLLNSLVTLLAQEPGFDSTGVLTARVRLGQNYSGMEPQRAFFRTLLDRLEQAPRIDEAGIVFLSPFSGGNVSGSFTIVGRESDDPDDDTNAAVQSVSPGFFELMRVPLVAGRTFDRRDSVDGEPVVIINEAAARRFWPDTDPIGQTLRAHITLSDQEGNVDRRVIGVVGDFRHRDLERAPQPFLYMPFEQYPTSSMYVYVRGPGDPALLAPTLRDVVADLDPNVLTYRVATLRSMISDSVAEDRFAATLTGLFALVAALLGSIGVYGVITFGVAERTNEIGVRMALGASATSVRGLVLRDTLVMTAIGLGLGLLGSVWLSGLLEGLLFGITATDPFTYTTMIALVALMAVAATALPARRASRIDPASALRAD